MGVASSLHHSKDKGGIETMKTYTELCVERGVKNLQEANLLGANLRGANLRGANLLEANLQGANLQWANLQWANLLEANLLEANLQGANLLGANLQGANLLRTILPAFAIVPEEGAFIGWKKTSMGIIRIKVLEGAVRVSSLVGRKCRASKILILDGPGCGGMSPTHETKIVYTQGATIEQDCDTDIRIECASGIHFFLTKQEAENW
jgi:hypothetical protein